MNLYKRLVDAHAVFWIGVVGFAALLIVLAVVGVMHLCGYEIEVDDRDD